jgi:replication fork protection complex subunit Tof1/Swi1
MFKDNKLRLLMTLVGFSRLGEAHDSDATWLVPSSLTSTQLQEAVDLIRKFEFDPPTYEDGKSPEELLRSKTAAARRSTRRVDFDDDDEGTENHIEEDRGEYGPSEPTARKPDGARKKLTRRRRAGTPVELDDEEKDRRAEARRKKDIEKQTKAWLSTELVHDSDDEDDTERDAEFFAREQALRENAFKNPFTLGGTDSTASKKRKAEETNENSKRQKTPPKRKRQPFDDSDDEDDEDMADVKSVSSRAMSESARNVMTDDSEEEATDTPLSSQHAGATYTSDGDTPRKPTTPAPTKSLEFSMADAEDDDNDDEEDEAPVVRRPMARNTRAGFVIDSDSE